MKYVDMNEVAFDPDCVVFPGLGNCHGVVYVNETGLFALHIFGSPTDSLGKIGAFGMFVRNHVNGRAKGVCLYGACPSNRHPKDKSHKAELQLVADALKFDGKIKGCRWDMETAGWRTTYTEFRCNRTEVTILIEDFSKGTFTKGSPENGLDHKYVKQVKNGLGPHDIAFSSCTVRDEVIRSVTRPDRGTGRQVTAWTL